MKSEQSEISLENLKFIFHHPWLFISPVVIILSLVFARISTIPPEYGCRAIIAFEASGSGLISEKFIQKKQDLIDSILLGENIGNVIKEVWPEITEGAEPLKYNSLVNMLRDAKYGIKTEYGAKEKGQENILTISFIYSNPNICYKVVRATIDTMRKRSKEKAEEELGYGLTVLKKQLDFYKDKLKAIDEETSRVKLELKKSYPRLSDEERNLVDEILNTAPSKDYNIQTQTKVQQLANYDDRLTELNLQLIELQRKKEATEERLKKEEFTPRSISPKDIEEDTFVKGYSSAIANKELNMAELLSQGYMQEHPNIKKIQGEMDRLKILREKRIDELVGSPGASGSSRRVFEETSKRELKDLGSQIESVNIKIAALENYRKTSEKDLRPAGAMVTSNVSTQASRLMELNSEKEINQKYYQDIRQQLEVAEIKNRMEREEVGIKINVIEEPRMPLTPIPFKTIKIIVLGLMISVASGIGLAYVVDALDTSIRSSSELRELLQIPVLASIDRINIPQEIRIQRLRRQGIVIGLIAFVVLSKIMIKIVNRFF